MFSCKFNSVIVCLSVKKEIFTQRKECTHKSLAHTHAQNVVCTTSKGEHAQSQLQKRGEYDRSVVSRVIAMQKTSRRGTAQSKSQDCYGMI